MKSILTCTALVTVAFVAGCAAQRPPASEFRSDARQPIRNREANVVLPMLVGQYEITDSRRNRRQIAAADLSIEGGVATLKLSTKEGQLVTTLQANECSGDLANKYTQGIYLACFGPELYGVRRHSFTISTVTAGYVHKSGGLIPMYDPMPVTGGYLIDFLPGDARGLTYPLAARRAMP